jgi:hypothetical protein
MPARVLSCEHEAIVRDMEEFMADVNDLDADVSLSAQEREMAIAELVIRLSSIENRYRAILN